MELKAKRGTVIYLILLGILVLMVTLIAFLLINEKKNFNNGTYSLNKYEEVSEFCDKEYVWGKASFNCRAILYKYDMADGTNEECFDIRMITKQDTLTDTFQICEEDGLVEWDKETLAIDMKAPININLTYSSSLFAPFRLSSISYSLISDDEIDDLLEILRKKNINIDNVRTQWRVDLLDKQYYTINVGPKDSQEEDKKIGIIYFITSKIKSVSIEGQNVVLDLEISIKGRKINTQIKVGKIFYFADIVESEVQEVTYLNAQEIVELKNAQISFFYLDPGSTLTQEDYESHCNDSVSGTLMNLVCSITPSINIFNKLEKGIDEYLLENVLTGENPNIDKLKLGFIAIDDQN